VHDTDRTGPPGGTAPAGSPRAALAVGGQAAAPRVRAVVLNYNGAADTLACVASLLRQDYGPLDIVVVDNASSSSDFAVLQSGLPQGTLLLRSEHNLGYAGGMNVGARVGDLPRPEFVLFLNNDLLLADPRTTGALVSAAEGDARRVAVSPLVAAAGVELPVECQVQVRRVPDFWTLLVAGSWWLRRLPALRGRFLRFVYADHRPYRAGAVYECESINGSCFLLRMSFLEEIGFLDEGTFLYLEELVLGRQMLDRDRTAALTAAVHVVHSLGRATGHGGERIRLAMLKEMVRSEIYYCKKYLRSGSTAVWLLVLVRTLDIASKMAGRPLVVVARRCAGALR
jgi:GT2 family glycosyltransferase